MIKFLKANQKIIGNIALAIVFVFWIFYGVLYINRNPREKFAYDTWAHIVYSEFISQNHRLPTPYYSYETYHPPLYYLVDQLFQPRADSHVKNVRTLSVFYGLVFLISIAIVATKLKIPKLIQALGILYLSTMPSFIFTFTSFNNDALVIPLCGVILVLIYSQIKNPSFSRYFIIAAITVAAVYTKFTAFYLLLGLFIFLPILVYLKKCSIKLGLKIMLSLSIGSISLLPYLYFHNYYYTQKFFPNNFESGFARNWDIQHQDGTIEFIFSLPIGGNNSWKTPFDMKDEDDLSYSVWQKRSYSGSVIVTSLFEISPFFGEGQLTLFCGWLALLSYSCLVIWAAIYGFKKAKAIILLIFLGLFANICHIYKVPYYIIVSYRYYAWVSLPFILLLGLAFKNSKSKKAQVILASFIVLGIIANIFFISSLTFNPQFRY